MIDFILSKFGILLFAVSVAGILLLFSAGMKDTFISDEGLQLSSVVSKQLKEMATSQSLCISSYVSLPKYIDVFAVSDTPTTTSLYYTLDINVVDIENNNTDDERKFVIFSLINKRTHKLMSVDSFITTDTICIKNPNTQPSCENNISIDPTKHNIIYLVKSSAVKTSDVAEATLFFIPCRYEKKDADHMKSCFDGLKVLAETEYAFCVPTSNPYAQTPDNAT